MKNPSIFGRYTNAETVLIEPGIGGVSKVTPVPASRCICGRGHGMPADGPHDGHALTEAHGLRGGNISDTRLSSPELAAVPKVSRAHVMSLAESAQVARLGRHGAAARTASLACARGHAPVGAGPPDGGEEG